MAAADIAAAIEFTTKLRDVSEVGLFGWSAGTQKAGLYAMQQPDRCGMTLKQWRV
jgi:dienelactone hydrolase